MKLGLFAVLFSDRPLADVLETIRFLNQSFQIESVTSHQELEIFPALSPNSKHVAFIRVAKGMQSNKLISKIKIIPINVPMKAFKRIKEYMIYFKYIWKCTKQKGNG